MEAYPAPHVAFCFESLRCLRTILSRQPHDPLRFSPYIPNLLRIPVIQTQLLPILSKFSAVGTARLGQNARREWDMRYNSFDGPSQQM
jgi:hypothetical protein